MESPSSNSQSIERIGELSIIDRVAIGPDEGLFLARTTDDAVVFVKRSSVAYRYDKNRRETYLQESKLARRLDQPNLAPFIRLEEVDGELIHVIHKTNSIALFRVLQMCRSRDVRIPTEIAFYILHQIVSALRYLHTQVLNNNSEHGQLHVALRPETIFLSDQGRCQIVQFSLSSPPSIASSILQDEDCSYMIYTAPEQCVPGLEPDYRADFFTLGILMFELLTSKQLFFRAGQIDESLITRRKVRGLHPLLSDVDLELAAFDDFVTGLLQPLPKNRTSDLQAIQHTIDTALRNYPRPVSEVDVANYVRQLVEKDTNVELTDSPPDDPSKPDTLTNIVEYNAS